MLAPYPLPLIQPRQLEGRISLHRVLCTQKFRSGHVCWKIAKGPP
jgi:hypothetical protein